MFDIVISYQVIEHVTKENQEKYLAECYRVLKKGGILYISTPNYFFPIEPHYRLPFIHWLPIFFSNIISRQYGAQTYDINLLSPLRVKYLLENNGFKVLNYTRRIMRTPKKYLVDKDFGRPKSVLLKAFSYLPFSELFSPTLIMVCKKD